MNILYKIRNLLNPEITHVWAPEEVYGPNCTGYQVVVDYRTRSSSKVLFRNDDEQLYTVYRSPLDAAISYYKAMNKKMQRQHERAARTR